MNPMFNDDPHLFIGTSSWSSKDWVGPFYPPGTRPEAFIEYYSTRFDTVEIDATFYRPPSRRTVAAWKRRTPERFRFAVKTPRVITHEKMLLDADDDMAAFLDTIGDLGNRLGPILLQFPYFNKQAFASEAPFMDRLDRFLSRLPAGFRYAIEVRNKTWIKDAHRVAASYGAALAWVTQAWMPTARQWPKLTGGPSADFAYIRWLGDHKAIEKITTSWDKLVVDCTEEVAAWVPVLSELRAKQIETFGYFNNHFAGHGPGSVALFQSLYVAG